MTAVASLIAPRSPQNLVCCSSLLTIYGYHVYIMSRDKQAPTPVACWLSQSKRGRSCEQVNTMSDHGMFWASIENTRVSRSAKSKGGFAYPSVWCSPNLCHRTVSGPLMRDPLSII